MLPWCIKCYLQPILGSTAVTPFRRNITGTTKGYHGKASPARRRTPVLEKTDGRSSSSSTHRVRKQHGEASSLKRAICACLFSTGLVNRRTKSRPLGPISVLHSRPATRPSPSRRLPCTLCRCLPPELFPAHIDPRTTGISFRLRTSSFIERCFKVITHFCTDIFPATLRQWRKQI